MYCRVVKLIHLWWAPTQPPSPSFFALSLKPFLLPFLLFTLPPVLTYFKMDQIRTISDLLFEFLGYPKRLPQIGFENGPKRTISDLNSKWTCPLFCPLCLPYFCPSQRNLNFWQRCFVAHRKLWMNSPRLLLLGFILYWHIF